MNSGRTIRECLHSLRRQRADFPYEVIVVDSSTDDTPEVNVMADVMGPLIAKGGIILHGEQSFEYHRDLVAGDVLVGEGKVVDIYEKDSKGKTMTFLVTENVFRDEKTGDPVVTTRMNLIHRS